MRICIPIKFKPEGGGFYFLDIFSRYLEGHGYELIQNISSNYEVLFTNSWMTPYIDLQKAIFTNPAVRIVQRVDGSSQNYGRGPEADEAQSKINTLADLTIFQSQYARYSTRDKYPVIAQDGPIIYNPVDLKVFHPKQESPNLKRRARIVSVTWSTNSMKGSRQIYEVIANNPDVDFVLCGNFPDAPGNSNVEVLGVLDRKDLSREMRNADVLLTFSRNEACPNHVIEALASGLPVLYADSGAMKEIIGVAGMPVNVEDFKQKLGRIMKRYQEFSLAARERATIMFNPEINLASYLNEIMGVLNRPLRVSATSRKFQAFAKLIQNRAGFGSRA